MHLNLKKHTLIKLVGELYFLSENKGSDWKMFDLFICVRTLNWILQWTCALWTSTCLFIYYIVACVNKRASHAPTAGYVTAPGISDAEASFTVTGLQVDVTLERVALQLLFEEIQGKE
jgi:hypothetical protein